MEGFVPLSSTGEIYRLLLDGHIVCTEALNKYKLIDDMLYVYCDEHSSVGWAASSESFRSYKEFSLYSEPSWEDKLAEQSKLCWVGHTQEEIVNQNNLASLITLEKKYTTRDGQKVELVTTTQDCDIYPVEGYIIHPYGERRFCCWTSEGRYSISIDEDEWDLVEVEKDE